VRKSKLDSVVSQDRYNALRDGQASNARRALWYLAKLMKTRVINIPSFTSRVLTISGAARTDLAQPSRGANNVHARGEFSQLLHCPCCRGVVHL
jgi:hypothetical protein